MLTLFLLCVSLSNHLGDVDAFQDPETGPDCGVRVLVAQNENGAPFLREDDLLLSWERLSPETGEVQATGTLDSPLKFLIMEEREKPMGLIRIHLLRNQEPHWILMPRGFWPVHVMPVLHDHEELVFQEGFVILYEGRFEEARLMLSNLARNLEARGEVDLAVAVLLELALSLRLKSEPGVIFDLFDDAFNMALGTASKLEVLKARFDYFGLSRLFLGADDNLAFLRDVMAGDEDLALLASQALCELALACATVDDHDRAQAFYEEALTVMNRLLPDSLMVAQYQVDQGRAARAGGKLNQSVICFEKALSIFREKDFYFMGYATALRGLAHASARWGDLEAAIGYIHQALPVFETHGGTGLVNVFLELGFFYEEQGLLSEAESFYRWGLKQSGKHPILRNDCLRSLGDIALKRGRLAEAEACFQEVLANLERRKFPCLSSLYEINMRLGRLAARRGDLTLAWSNYSKAEGHIQKLAPLTLRHARVFNRLGEVAFRGDRLEKAQYYYQKALHIHQQQAPDTLGHAASLNQLGLLARRRGNLEEALSFFEKARAIQEVQAPGSLDLAQTFYLLGELERDQGRLTPAASYFQNAWEIRALMAPGSADEADALFALARLHQEMTFFDEALAYYEHALETLSHQLGRFGGTEDLQTLFAARYDACYKDMMALLLMMNRPVEAFHVLERSRAGVLHRMMVERDLALEEDIPADLKAARVRSALEYDRIQARIAKLHPEKDGETLSQLLQELREVRNKREWVRDQIRRQHPILAELQHPSAFDLRQAQQALEPGVLMLSYGVGQDKTFLFAVSKPLSPKDPGLQVFVIPVGEAQWNQRIRDYRKWLQRPQTTGPLLERGRLLFEDLLGPAAHLIAGAERLLVCPDRALRSLPFAALPMPEGSPFSWMAEHKPVHTVVSATIYAGLKRRGPQNWENELVALGNPVYPQEDGSARQAHYRSGPGDVFRSLRDFSPLPGTVREINALQDLFGERGRYLTGAQAMEATAKTAGQGSRYLHFACHGVVDENSPLDSALILSIPDAWREGEENGVLQAWEIMEQMRVDAELVVLSACETGLGADRGGEGFLGLTRAFQFAGASSILASLWKVSDTATAALMSRFYQYLKIGLPKDQALRKAQLDLLQGRMNQGEENLTHPYYWAAFQLIGRWD